MTPAHAPDTAARMDRMYRYQRHIYDLTRKHYLLGRERLIDQLAPAPGAAVAEIGCGTGHNLIALARRYPEIRLFGIDPSAAMLETARHKIQRAGLEHRIRLAQGLGEELDPFAMFNLVGYFDAIVISYALSMIPDWQPVVVRAVDNLRRGGTLAVVDFWDQRDLSPWFRQGLQRWLALFDVHPRGDMPDFFQRLARDRAATARYESVWHGYAFHLTYTARD
jgi:S-adenosylmethionine-diacylgycerolhomoserine-N-methlytransferase